MFKRLRKKNPMLDYLDEQIESTAERMLKLDSDSDEYKKANDQFLKLITSREELAKGNKIKPETWLLVGSNLAGILIVLNYEHAHVLTSKAFSWITRPKI